ncbi:MAG: ATP-binding protein [Fibrobacterota bacterium]
MTIWCLLPLSSAFLFFTFGFFVLYKKPRALENRIFFLYCLLGAHLAFCIFMGRNAESMARAYLWLKAGSFWPLLLVLQFHFVVVFTGNRDKILAGTKAAIALFYGIGSILTCLLLFTDNVYVETIKMYWGYTYKISENPVIIIPVCVWSMGLSLLSLFLLYHRFQGVHEKKKRKQMQLVLTGLSFSTVAGILTEALPPLFNLKIPEMATTFTLATPLCFGYAIYRYELFSLCIESLGNKIVAALSDCLFVIDLDNRIRCVNESVPTLLGYSREELMGLPIRKVIEQTESSLDSKVVPLMNLQRAGVSDATVFLVAKDGRKTPASLSTSLVDNDQGEVEGVVYIAKDISRRKQMEEELKKASFQLQAVNKELEAFSYSVSHDLRSPLRAIDGFSKVLLDDYNEKLDAEGKDCLNRIRTATQNMGDLIDAVLMLAGVTRKVLQPEKTDMSALAQEVVSDLHQRQPGREITILIAPGLTAEGDKVLLRQVLENLLGNAWKFTEKQPQPRIEFGWIGHDRPPTFFVRDNGAGFDMAYVEKLFQPFQRLHSMREFAGFGIGLANVQRIVHRHGGHIWAESQVGKGARFFFTLQFPENPNH